MTDDNAITRYLAGSPIVAAAAYCLIVGALAAMTWSAAVGVLDSRHALAETEDLLHQLEIRETGNASKAGTEGTERSGSPFLEGPTVTVAGAALLQRVAGAIVKAGGNIASSQVDVGKAQTKEGMIGLLISCEMEQSSLQKLLYDIEAGMPFLFVDQLDVQVAQATANRSGAERIRVMIGVSGQWQGSK